MSIRGLLREPLSRIVGGRQVNRLGTTFDDLVFWSRYVASPEGRHSLRRLHSLHNRFHGRRAFVLGNGPSLARMDLSPLCNEVTFGLNRAYLMFPDLGFPTTFLVAGEQNVIQQFGWEMARADSHTMLSHRFARRESLPPTVTHLLSRRKPVFGTDPGFWGFHDGNTVTYIALQLAFYFGFEEVILIGIDHSFSVPQGRHQRGAVVVGEGNDPNHFHPDYFGEGIRWMLPDLEGSEVSYRRAKAHYERHGRRVLDATVGGRLNVFAKIAWDDVINASGSPSDRPEVF